jgi:hypothetical protein
MMAKVENYRTIESMSAATPRTVILDSLEWENAWPKNNLPAIVNGRVGEAYLKDGILP